MKIKSNRAIFTVITFIIMGIILSAYHHYYLFKYNGITIESRENLLDKSISKGEKWNIAVETEIDGYIISGGYSSNNKTTLAVFKPLENGNYKFLTSTNGNKNDIIICTTSINSISYDIIWFNGAQTEYAEITYTLNGKQNETLKFDTTNMDIIVNEAPSNDYSMNILYYDNEGNVYE